MKSLFADLLVRTILIISITDALIFYLMWAREITLTLDFAIEVIIVTIIPMVISLWYDIKVRKLK